ncbi:hypothetical protein FRC19_001150, partial [Serendipita sp. 401]
MPKPNFNLSQIGKALALTSTAITAHSYYLQLQDKTAKQILQAQIDANDRIQGQIEELISQNRENSASARALVDQINTLQAKLDNIHQALNAAKSSDPQGLAAKIIAQVGSGPNSPFQAGNVANSAPTVNSTAESASNLASTSGSS